jgi:hypothetical protein
MYLPTKTFTLVLLLKKFNGIHLGAIRNIAKSSTTSLSLKLNPDEKSSVIISDRTSARSLVKLANALKVHPKELLQ